MKIVFSRHTLLDKFTLLRKHGFDLTKNNVLAVIKNPEHTDRESDYPKIIVSADLDKTHILRVVYKMEHGIIKIITFYPAEKGRYY